MNSPVPSVEVRQISISDIELVIDLFDQYRVFYNKESDLVQGRQFIYERLINNESVIFVALAKQQGRATAIGFAQLYPAYSSARMEKNWILNDLFVTLEYRKRGAGQQLITAAMQFARYTGAKFLKLETAHNNLTAQRLYEALGFKPYDPNEGFITYKIDVN